MEEQLTEAQIGRSQRDGSVYPIEVPGFPRLALGRSRTS